MAQATAVTSVRAEQARLELVQARAVAASRVRAASARKATAVVVRAPKPVETYLARGTRVYASLHYDVTRLGYRIAFRPGSRGLLGITDAGSRTITIYVRSGMSDLVLSHTIAHETGHALDVIRGSALTQARFLAIRGLSGTLAWFGCSSCTDYATPAGDWAEVFANWLAGPGDFRSRLAAAPTADQLRALAPLFSL